jgi:hypothetical protein
MQLLLYRRGGVRAHKGGWGDSRRGWGALAWLAAHRWRLDPKPSKIKTRLLGDLEAVGDVQE